MLDGPGIEFRWGGGASFSAPVQTGSGAQPVSYSMGPGYLSWIKAAGAWRWSPTPSRSPRLKKE